jgi:FAD/FMN-containing dehydrogenase
VSTIVHDDALSSLSEAMRGELLLPSDEGYDTARHIFNGMIDRRPAAIARVRGTSDVLAAIGYARERGLPVAVRGGGHNVAGHGTCDDGLLIDFSLMRSARVDLASQTVRADPGCNWIDFDAETSAHGYATTGGTVGSTGIAGLTLGGGLGFLMGSYGLTCDNVVSVDVVTADGSFLTANEESHSDLFWGIRGGGGNFGVVTSFEYRLHRVERLLAGLVAYSIEHARAALELFREVTERGPDELSCAFVMVTTPDGGPPIAAIAACYNGPIEHGERAVAPIRRLGPPLDDDLSRGSADLRGDPVRAAELLEGPLRERPARRGHLGHGGIVRQRHLGSLRDPDRGTARRGPTRPGGRHGLRPASGKVQRKRAGHLGGSSRFGSAHPLGP